MKGPPTARTEHSPPASSRQTAEVPTNRLFQLGDQCDLALTEARSLGRSLSLAR
jgi:hypothetical protein